MAESAPIFDRPEDYWVEFEADLAKVFGQKCAYCVMIVPKADMDHFIPVAKLKKRKQEELAYEWDNFRYVEGTINKAKSDLILLDPFKVKDDWFEISLPSLQLQLTANVPKYRRKVAELTLEKLGLDKGEVVVRYRSTWFEMYRERKLILEGLKLIAPLIAKAVERDLAAGIDWQYAVP